MSDRLLTLRDLAVMFGSLSNEQFAALADSGIYDYLLLWVPAAESLPLQFYPSGPVLN